MLAGIRWKDAGIAWKHVIGPFRALIPICCETSDRVRVKSVYVEQSVEFRKRVNAGEMLVPVTVH